jgi:SHS2 domain-containing protein
MTASSRTLQHVGEWKVELRADSLEQLFAELARVIASETGVRRAAGAAADAWERVAIESRDYPALLVDWANELIGRSEVTGCAYGEVRSLRIDPGSGRPPRDNEPVRLSAEVRGESVEEWASVLKAATYHDAVVERADGGWRGEVLFDV